MTSQERWSCGAQRRVNSGGRLLWAQAVPLLLLPRGYPHQRGSGAGSTPSPSPSWLFQALRHLPKAAWESSPGSWQVAWVGKLIRGQVHFTFITQVASYVPGISFQHYHYFIMLICFILQSVNWEYCYTHWTDEETGAQKGFVICQDYLPPVSGLQCPPLLLTLMFIQQACPPPDNPCLPDPTRGAVCSQGILGNL